ncbi:MAG TPA: cysteine hydrolase [Nitrososphaerales archaeon]|nr:cysteine hydrolase [Nitrososphaerales archaeon]
MTSLESGGGWSFEELVNPDHTALIVVDMQKDYCSKDYGFCKLGFSVDAVQAMAPRLAKFIRASRESGVLIIYTRNQHSTFTDTTSWKRFGAGKLGLARKNSEGENWFEDYEEFTPAKEDYVIFKHRYNAFLGTDLEIVLKAKKIETILLTGTATNVCVESTAREGAMRDFNVVLVGDCTSTYDPKLQEATERNVANHFGIVSSSEKISRAWNAKTTPRNELSQIEQKTDSKLGQKV